MRYSKKVLRRVREKSFIRRNQARVHICSSCLALPLALRTRVWQPRVWQTSFRLVRHTRSYLSNYISRRPRRFLFRSSSRTRARVRNALASRLYFLFSLAAGKSLLRCQDASGAVPITGTVVATLEKEIPMHKYIRAKRAPRVVSILLTRPFRLPTFFLPFAASLCFPIFPSFFFSSFRPCFLLSLTSFHRHRAMATRTFFQFPE